MATPTNSPGVGPTGAEALIRALERAGAGIVFGVPGPHNLPLVTQLRAQGVRFIATQRPDAALVAAGAHASRTGRLGVAITGPGASPLPLLDALRTCARQGAQVLLIDVGPPVRPQHRRPGDAVPAPEPDPSLAAMGVDLVVLGPSDDISAVVKAARDQARRAPTGPVVLHVPGGLLQARVAAEPDDPEATADSAVREPAPGVEHVQLRRAANLVDASQNLLIWAGGGAMQAGAGGAVAELAEKVGAPVVTTIQAAGLLPARHPCLIGLPPHIPGVGALWDGADLVVAIGTDFDDETTQGGRQPAPDALIAINVDAVAAGQTYRPDVLLRGDARTLTKALADTVSYRGGTAVVRSKLDEVRGSVRRMLEAEHGPEAAFVHAVSAAIPDRATVVADPCAAGRWIAAFHEWTLPRTLWFPADLDAVGAGVPAAIGSAAVGSTEPVLGIVGDQGFLAMLGELATLARERLPLTLLVVDDGGAGRLRPMLEESGLDPTTLDRQTLDLASTARTFGLRADTIDVVGEELTTALRAHIAAPDPTVLVVQARLGPPPTARERWYRRSGDLA